MKKYIVLLSMLFLLLFGCSISNNCSEKTLVSLLQNIKQLDLQKEIKSIKASINHIDIMKIDKFQLRYGKDGSIQQLLLNFICQNNNKYLFYEINYDTIKKQYIIQNREAEKWLGYEALYDENQLVESFKQLSFDELTLYQNINSIYDSFTLRYFEETNNISKTSASNVYKVTNGKKQKLINNEQIACGLALVVSGNKVLKSQNRTSIESNDGSIYVFAF
ncbi:hypothetical protein [Pseudobacteroides cellulosolvens]|uniref:Lipoprotein n=1 Tax=Pseudobacteroides cellulosolvens ATCC 35603 = DSM 2933 TaxID=398512 RepID=A0A0L6JX85_9FIRM|nr:hypothetical protein [Pseudobacteroides cellulosolvens]KNY30349.1 hypothetical protein Bccel_5629 [Pseudobacteroides cellulosolvens ATCC 35603 = DSM 2933]